jgi:ribonuclease HI
VIEIWTDGSCDVHHEKKPGAWSYLIRYKDESGEVKEEEDTIATFPTTNNVMEGTAILKAIKKVKELKLDGPITVKSDSRLFVMCIRKQFKAKDKKIKDLVWKIWLESKDRILNIEKVRAHRGNPENERVNKKAQEAMQTLKAILNDEKAMAEIKAMQARRKFE